MLLEQSIKSYRYRPAAFYINHQNREKYDLRTGMIVVARHTGLSNSNYFEFFAHNCLYGLLKIMQ